MKPVKPKNPVNQRLGRRSKTKGADFERLIAKRFQAVYADAKRGIGQARSAKEVSDVDGTPWWVECKHRKDVSVPAALRQARKDGDGRPVVVVWRQSAKHAIHATLDVNTFIRAFAKVDAACGKEPADAGELTDVTVDLDLDCFLRLLKGGWKWL